MDPIALTPPPRPAVSQALTVSQLARLIRATVRATSALSRIPCRGQVTTAQSVSAAADTRCARVLRLRGSHPRGKPMACAAAAAEAGLPVFALACMVLPPAAAGLSRLALACRRDLCLTGARLLLDAGEAAD